MATSKYAAVVVDLAVPRPLDYEIPEEMREDAQIGMRVKVPLRGRSYPGTILELKETPEIARTSLIQEMGPASIPSDLLKLGIWISNYYCSPFYKVLKQLLPPSIRSGMEEKQQLFVKPLLSRPEMSELCQKKTGAQRDILDALLQAPKGILLTELLEKTGASRSPLTTLAKQGVVSLSPLTIDRSPLAEHEFFPTKPKILSLEQQNAFDQILLSLQSKSFQTHLLFGVTGSGKTEVYLQAIEAALAQGRSALFLVPEIALTSQTVERLRSRFQERVAILHHRLSAGERRDSWHKIRSGEISLVVGPRSALFSPLKNLGLIIVDEEHDGAYKQSDEMPCYQGRDVAVMRGKLCDAAVILGSATPSLESYCNALQGKYHLNPLLQRADSATLPTVHIVNMKPEYAKARGFTLFSEKLLSDLKKRMEVGEQSLLFLNRRGFHTSSVCQVCSEALQCPHCSITLTFHKGDNLLSCHLCNYETRPLTECPSCKAHDSFKFKGAGTEHVERALHAIFPEVRTLRLDADTTKHKGSHDKVFKQFRAGKADVLIGTQMIAKGLHFPSVTLVGILNPDMSLHIPDFRASEHVFQLITQVAGRSGRSQIKGEVILQTTLPNHPLFIQAARLDYPAFYQEEIQVRKAFNFPPFCHLVKLVFTGEDATFTEAYAQKLRSQLIQKLPPSFELNPVIPCGYAKIKNQYRFQCLIKGETTRPITDLLKTTLPPSSIRLLIDVDPLSTYF
jgi:primosomal protein N' (replication factor Y) (superfamily II helicase)